MNTVPPCLQCTTCRDVQPSYWMVEYLYSIAYTADNAARASAPFHASEVGIQNVICDSTKVNTGIFRCDKFQIP